MNDLHRYLINPYATDSYGIAALASFASDHIGKMRAKSIGSTFTERIAATSEALTTVETAFATDLGKLGLRKMSKQAKDEFRAAMPAAISKIYATLIAKYGERSAEMKQFFPNGRSGFGRMSDDLLGSALQQLVTAVTSKQTELGAEVVPQASTLLSGWNAVFAPSESSGDAKSASKDAKNAARAALQHELYLNLLTIALQFPHQPDKLDLYMQPSLLDPNTPSAAASSSVTPVAPVVSRDASGKWTCTFGGQAQDVWQVWARGSVNATWSATGEIRNSNFPAQDADIVPDGASWWQVKFCGEGGDGNQSTPFSNVISFGPVPA